MDNQKQQHQQQQPQPQHVTDGEGFKRDDPAAAEFEAVSSFLKIVNNNIRGNGSVNPMSEKTALKFLISRKFDVDRAIELYQMHEIIRLREGLTNIDPNDQNLKAELESGKFTILKQRDTNNSAIAVFTAKLHVPSKSSRNNTLRRETNRITLQGIVYQLDSALEDIITQRNGIVFIYNMNDSDYSNFDSELCQKILNLLKGAYPAKLKKVLIVSPPVWFRVPFQFLRLIVREKLRDRVTLLSMSQLPEHLPKQALTPELGGSYQHDHQAWIAECNSLYKTRFDDLCDPTSAQNLSKAFSNKPNSLKRSSREMEGFDSDLDSPSGNDLGRMKSKIKPSVYEFDDSGQSLSQFVESIRKMGRSGLEKEYDSLSINEKNGTFEASSKAVNMKKNRYINVKCYDHSRVVLEQYDRPDDAPLNDPMDYINANYIDGYQQSKAYISTQGPFGQTIVDFWRMIWQTGSRVIVMVTLTIENDILKCDEYWPNPNHRLLIAGIYKVEYMGQEKYNDFIMTHLKLTNTKSDVSRDIYHLQFISWPDFGTPLTATALLEYREKVLEKQLDAIAQTGNTTYPPIVVHCSAGVGRSGTFITIDTCIQKLETTGLVDVKSVVEKLRQQRYLSIQTKEQYIFCYKSVLEYAANCTLLDGINVDGLFGDK